MGKFDHSPRHNTLTYYHQILYQSAKFYPDPFVSFFPDRRQVAPPCLLSYFYASVTPDCRPANWRAMRVRPATESQTRLIRAVAENQLESADCKYKVSEACTGNILPL